MCTRCSTVQQVSQIRPKDMEAFKTFEAFIISAITATNDTNCYKITEKL